MSYFNPKIYNKENLHEDDRADLEFWHEQFTNLLEDERPEACHLYGSETLAKMVIELVNTYKRNIKIDLDTMFQEMIVGLIDGYEDDVPEQENPTFFGNLYVDD